jgi:hypothetical protein
MVDFVSFFDEWDQCELNQLRKLKMPGGQESMDERKCKHLIYLFEIALGIAIEPSMNISGNPGCEWLATRLLWG